MPASAVGNITNENRNVEQQEMRNDVQNTQNVIREDAQSRVRDRDEEEKEPQIDNEGEFNNQTGWTREEGLSDEERREAEEEDLDGRHSGDGSVL